MGISPIRTDSNKVDTSRNRYNTGIRRNPASLGTNQSNIAGSTRNDSKAATEAADLPSIRRKLSLPADTVVCTSIDGDLATFSGSSMKLCKEMKHTTPELTRQEKEDHIIRMLESRHIM